MEEVKWKWKYKNHMGNKSFIWHINQGANI